MTVATASFLLFAATQVGGPGPANMALLAAGARYGFAGALPFVAGVVVGKQLLIWPLGLWLLALLAEAPAATVALKWLSAAYILWLAWRIAGTRLGPGRAAGPAPGFLAGLAVHPLNPKAWAMITAGFTAFTAPGTPALQATSVVAICLLLCQIILHPLWTLGGDRLARGIAGTAVEVQVMRVLATLMVLSVLLVFWGGDVT